MGMNSLSLSDNEVRFLVDLLWASLRSAELKRQAIIIAHGNIECPDCLSKFDATTLEMQAMYNKITEFVE